MKTRTWLNGMLCAGLCLASPAAWPFSIDLSFDGGLSAGQAQLVDNARDYWQSVLIGYIDGTVGSGHTPLSGITIDVTAADLDGRGGTLGSTGVTFSRFDGQFRLAAAGTVTLDVGDLPQLETSGGLYDVAVHELAHALGFGTLWEANGVYVAGSGRYTGAAALAVYRNAVPGATHIPVELDVGAGSDGGHWDEQVFGSELMTGVLDSPAYIDDITLASFIDIGYELQPGLVTVPLPSGAVLVLSALVPLAAARRPGGPAARRRRCASAAG